MENKLVITRSRCKTSLTCIYRPSAPTTPYRDFGTSVFWESTRTHLAYIWPTFAYRIRYKTMIPKTVQATVVGMPMLRKRSG